MTEYNIGSAILILGCLYFGYSNGFEWWLIGLVLLACATWAYPGFSKERKELVKSQINLNKAKTEYYREKSRVEVKQTK